VFDPGISSQTCRISVRKATGAYPYSRLLLIIFIAVLINKMFNGIDTR